jgi:hypothetical protein
MYKLFILLVIVFSGCTHFRITAPICDQINTEAGDIPKECRVYNKEKAYKAFDKVDDSKKPLDKDVIEFHKEEK